MRKSLLSAVVLTFVAQAAPAAFAQGEGKVTTMGTEPGSVLVERGGEIYQLKLGDTVFPGDRIFTRTNGALRFNINGCDVGLGGQQSILVKIPDVCTTLPTTLAANDTVGGVTIGTGGAIGATPGILLALLVGGGAAAASAGGDESEPASP